MLRRGLVKYIGLCIFALTLLSACGSKLDGTTYESHNRVLGTTTVRFDKGEAYITALDMETVYKYEVDGNKVKLNAGPQGILVLTLNKDGSLDGWPTGKLVKKK